MTLAEPATSQEDICRRIEGLAADLARLGVRSLSLFGSAARDRLQPESDVDFLVEFDGPARFDPFMDLKLLLEDSLGRPVDLTTTTGMKPMLRARIEPELLRVA